jgi:DNA invertase Pin-like site-specific DNA recombinase
VKAAIYVRVSTQDQSLDNQLPDLERLAAARQLTVVETFAEKVSAAKARPQLDRLLADAHRGRFQVVIVWSLDRLHRSMLGALQTVLDLDRMGVQVVSLREPWLDTGGPVRPRGATVWSDRLQGLPARHGSGQHQARPTPCVGTWQVQRERVPGQG